MLASAALLLIGLTLQATAIDRPILMAHYMPWYATKTVSGHWGWHWTMNKFDPEKRLPDGRREAASHDYPLIDLYDSSDPHTLECQVQLMKLAGIDGVIVDWYGIKDFHDYEAIHRNTQALISVLKRAGLKFAICYEDQSIKHMVTGKALTPDAAVGHGHEVFQWMAKNWFRDEAYLSLDGKPLLLVFGPQYFEAAQWKEILTGIEPQPRMHVLPHLTSRIEGAGKFGWPPVAGGKTISRKEWLKYFDQLYFGKEVAKTVVSVAFPGFHDIYNDAGLHDSYGFIDETGGRTLTESLDRALTSGAPVVQIATWNDYGEGTVIEPTRRRQFQHLEEIQKRRRPQSANKASAGPSDLKLPVRLFELRKAASGDERASKLLDEASAKLLSSDIQAVRSHLQQLAQ